MYYRAINKFRIFAKYFFYKKNYLHTKLYTYRLSTELHTYYLHMDLPTNFKILETNIKTLLTYEIFRM